MEDYHIHEWKAKFFTNLQNVDLFWETTRTSSYVFDEINIFTSIDKNLISSFIFLHKYFLY